MAKNVCLAFICPMVLITWSKIYIQLSLPWSMANFVHDGYVYIAFSDAHCTGYMEAGYVHMSVTKLEHTGYWKHKIQ